MLVNNAGFGTYGKLTEIDAERDHELVAVNVDALVRLNHAVLPGMLDRGRGGILNVASTIAFQPAPSQATYGASKAFVLSFSQALRAEAKGSGVAVTALCPGPTRTGYFDALGADVTSVAVHNDVVYVFAYVLLTGRRTATTGSAMTRPSSGGTGSRSSHPAVRGRRRPLRRGRHHPCEPSSRWAWSTAS